MKRSSVQSSFALGLTFAIAMMGFSRSVGAADALTGVLKERLLKPGEARHQHDAYVLSKIPPLKLAKSKEGWQRQASDLRKKVLDQVVFRGVPAGWRSGKPAVVRGATIETGAGYRIRKLRYEALPGLWIPALLYEPKSLNEKTPAILNVNGHAATGKSTGYKQIRCINLAKRGMLALNLEWIGMGQLRSPDYSHNHLAKLDLCGRAGLSVFYLAMSRGLDVLLDHPHADPERVAVTGLSGGGWQTIILSSLDPRVRLSVPVAGHSALAQRVANRSSIGDLEQNPNDLISIVDYVHLNALMTPRPLLLIYNTKDNCCFAAPTVKANTYEPVIPFYQQAGVPQRLGYHENDDPGTHNYEKDNRQQLYKFLNQHFLGGKGRDEEIPSEKEVLKHAELNVPLPEKNAHFHSLAADAARALPKPLANSRAAWEKLRSVLRVRPLPISADLFTGPRPQGEFQVRRLRIQTGEHWVLPGIVVESAKVTRHVVVIADGGYASQAERVEKLAREGACVLCLDLTLFGQANPGGTLYPNAMLIAAVGDRPLGLQATQLQNVARWYARVFVASHVDLISEGPRTGLAARCAAALDGGKVIRRVETVGALRSLKELLGPEASYNRTPEAYCFGLLQHFDLPQLIQLAAPSK